MNELFTNNEEMFLMNNEILRFVIGDAYQMSMFINLTKNKFRLFEYSNLFTNHAEASGEFDELIDMTSNMIPDKKQKEQFLQTFTRESLIKEYKSGNKKVILRYQQMSNDGNLHWIETRGVFVKKENSNDITILSVSVCVDCEMKQMNHLKSLLQKKNIYKTAVNSDATGYFEVNLTKDLIIGDILEYYGENHDEVKVEPDIPAPVSYSKLMGWLIENRFKSDSNDYMLNTDKELLISIFHTGKRIHQIEFSSYDKNRTLTYHQQMYFMDEDEKTGDIVAICVLKDISDIKYKEAELKRNHEIISVLSSEYENIFYLNMVNEKMVAYRMTDNMKNTLLAPYDLNKLKYSDIWEHCVNNFVSRHEIAEVLREIKLDNIREQLSTKKFYSVIFSSDSFGVSRYYEAKFVKIGESSNPESIIIGFSNKDEEFRKEKERQFRMNQNYDIIKVLASEYDMVLHINLVSDTFTPYNLSGDIGKILAGLMRKGLGFSEVKDIYVNRRIHEEDKERIRIIADPVNIRKQLEDKKSFVEIYRATNNNDEIHYYELRVVRVGDKKNIESVVIGIADKNEEISERNNYNRQLEEARLKAEEANKAKSTFLFNMSHDIRTPMNAIIGFTSMAKKYINNPEQVLECLDKVELSGNHLLSLINDVLDMARIENNKIIIEETPNNILFNVMQLVDIMQPSACEKDIELTFDVRNMVNADVYIDALRLNRVMMNILSNSLKYTKPGGSIEVILEQKPCDREGYAAYDVTISDTGIGMSKKFLATIFDSFTREKTSTVSGIQGTGLGMAITKSFVELMGGNIEIDSALGIGTTVICHFYFRIQQNTEESAGEDTIDDDIDFTKMRILLVEDNELNREIARDILEEMEITVEEANDGSIAVDMVSMKEAGYYDLIFMDIQMPYMDGYKATQVIRSINNKDVASIPIIAMTANAFEEDRRKAIEVGMNGHLAKPLNIPEIMKTLAKYAKK